MNEELLPIDQVRKAQAPLEQAWTLPPAAYIQPHVFDREKVTVFSKGWLCVAREEQLAEPGDYLCVDLIDQPIVVSRDHRGALHALSRVCVHRAMPVAEGSGNATRFVCPYHKWTYELDGRLRSAPMMQGAEAFETSRCQLPRLSLEVWEGFVFVNLDTHAAPLAPQVSGLSELIGNYGFANLCIAATTEFDSPWNWKILVENFMEAYHHIGTHKQSLEPIFPARDSSVPDNHGQPWSFLHMPGLLAPEGPLLPGLETNQQKDLFAAAIFPSFLFAASSSNGIWYQLEPKAHDQMNLRIHLLLPPTVIDAMSEEELLGALELVRMVHLEDIEANEGPWRGLRAPMTGPGRLSPYEKAIWQLNQYWLKALELT